MQVRIYSPSRSAMQSGRGKVGRWMIDVLPESGQSPESLMGWTSSADTQSQVRLRFESADDALRYAQKQGWEAVLDLPHERKLSPRNYADRFAVRKKLS